MTTSTDGILCYGFIINEGVDLPWNAEEYDRDFDSWYYTEVKDKNPAPFELVNYCSCKYPMFVLAVVRIECERGNPTTINPLELLEYSEEDTKELKEFAVKYNLIDETDKPEWWLCSYWG